MSFRLVPKSVTLNDLERRNSPNVCVILRNSVAFGTDYAKVFEDTPILSAAKCSPKNLLFSGVLFIWIFTEVTENECVTKNHREIT